MMRWMERRRVMRVRLKKAFSRRRGFTKKRKKERREQRDAAMGYD